MICIKDFKNESSFMIPYCNVNISITAFTTFYNNYLCMFFPSKVQRPHLTEVYTLAPTMMPAK